MQQRKSNIELLRIFTMYIIVVHHIALHSGFVFESGLHINKLIVQFLQLGGKLGVDIFIIISGYFMICSHDDNKQIKYKGFRLWLQVEFYSIISLAITFLIGRYDMLTSENIMYSVFPVIWRQYWFFSVYVIMIFLSPYINIIINKLDRKEHKRLLITLVIIWSVIQTITNKNVESNELSFFLLLYIMGAYIRKYLNVVKIKYCVVMLFIDMFFTLSSVTIIDYLEYYIPGLCKYETYFFGLQKVNICILALLIFLLFREINIKPNKLINTAASTMFGVYLIHDNIFMREYLWKDIFKLYDYQCNNCIGIIIMIVAFIVMIVAALLDLVRQKIFENKIDSLIKKYM